MNPMELIITRHFDAPRPLVYEAWTQPEHLAQWGAPHGFSIPSAGSDLKVGGQWHIQMVPPNGDVHRAVGVYREIVPNELLVFTHAWEGDDGQPEWETLVTVRFEDEKDGTLVTFQQSGFRSAESRDKHQDGWSQCLDRLTESLSEKGAFLQVERTFDAPPAAVWKALTDPEALREWYFEIPNFRAEPGCEFGFVVEHEGNVFFHLCRVTKVVPEKELAYTWRYEGQPGDSLVTFSLHPEGAKTRLRVTHRGIETFPPTAEYRRSNFHRGWTSLLGSSLKDYLGTRA